MTSVASTGEASYSEVSPPVSVAVSSLLASESKFLSKRVQPPHSTCIDFSGHHTKLCISSSSALVATLGVDYRILEILKNSLFHAFDVGHQKKSGQRLA